MSLRPSSGPRAAEDDQVRTGRLGREHAFGSAMSFGHRMQGVYHGEVADIVNTAECCTQLTTSVHRPLSMATRLTGADDASRRQ